MDMCDSWIADLRRIGNVHEDDGSGLGCGARGFSRLSASTRSQRCKRRAVSRGAALFRGPQRYVAGFTGAVRELEQRLETVLAFEPGGCVRRLFRAHGGAERVGASGPDVRQHGSARPCLGGGRKRGQEGQALGRSRGGFSTKIHLKTDFDGHPIAFDLTGGEKADAPQFETLLEAGPEITPRAALADKGYDSRANRAAARGRGVVPVIPHRSNTKEKPNFFPKILYKARSRIEQAVGKLKRFKRVALRCEKTATNFRSFVALAAAFILIKSVHTT